MIVTRSQLVANCQLSYTNVQRNTTDILSEQTSALRRGDEESVEQRLLEIRDIGIAIGASMRACDFDTFGNLMHEHWMSKKRLSGKVTLPVIEDLYDHVRAHYGVLGGKVAGAGGGVS